MQDVSQNIFDFFQVLFTYSMLRAMETKRSVFDSKEIILIIGV